MARATKQWKAFEARVAKGWGLRRVPTSGSNSGVTSADAMKLDPTTGKAPIYIECKYRGCGGSGKNTWPHGKLWYDSKKKADKEKIPVVMCAHGDKHRHGYMVTIHSSQLVEFARLVLEHYRTEEDDVAESDDTQPNSKSNESLEHDPVSNRGVLVSLF